MHLGAPSSAKRALCKLKRGHLHTKFAKTYGVRAFFTKLVFETVKLENILKYIPAIKAS